MPNFSAPIVITAPGTYVLTADIVTSGHAIVIKSDNVVIDLNGHTVTGPGTAENKNYGVSSFGYNNITVKNGSVTGFLYGVYLSARVDQAKTMAELVGGGHLVENITITDCTFRGMRVEGNNNVVQNNSISEIGGTTAYNNAYAFGIESFGQNALIANNVVSEVRGGGDTDIGEGVGISVSFYGNGSRIIGNTVSNEVAEYDSSYPTWSGTSRSTYGIWVGGEEVPYSQVTVDNNTVSNFIFGVTFKRSVGGSFAGNSVTGAYIPYYLPDPFNTVSGRVTVGANNTSDIAASEMLYGRPTAGQIEYAELNYLSPLHRISGYYFTPVRDISAGGETIIGVDGRYDMVDYWASATSVSVSLETSSALDATGTDTLVSIEGAQGSTLADTLIGNSDVNLLAGSWGDDTLFGRGGDDFLFGDDNNDWLYGEADNDTLDGGIGTDMLFGGAGANRLIGDTGFDYARYDDADYGALTVSLRDTGLNTGVAAGDTFSSVEGLIGGMRSDTLYGDDADNYVYSMDGNDVVFGLDGIDALMGGNGNDMLYGGPGADILDGGAGYDYARYDDADYGALTVSLRDAGLNTGAAAGDSYADIEGLIGGMRADNLYGNDAANYVYGMDGNDRIFGLDGNDALIGGNGNDMLHGGPGADVLDGGAGYDYVRYDDADYGALTVSLRDTAFNTGAAAGDSYIGIEGLIGGMRGDTLYGNDAANYVYGMDGNDIIFGLDGNDALIGGAGNDMLHGGPGADIIDGGAGFDYARYDDAGYGPLTINLKTPSASTGAAVGDTFLNIEGVVGGQSGDTIIAADTALYAYGMGGDDVMTGGAGRDTFLGGAGSDTLNGGLGSDTLTGGASADVFVFSSALGSTNIDTIKDFAAGEDMIRLDHAIFAALSAGALDTAAFAYGASASGTAQRILYNSATGALIYDADGNASGGVSGMQFSTLSLNLSLTASSFTVA